MERLVFPPPLYQLLRFTGDLEEKTVLDCGAGGRRPPLALFRSHGFETSGIDISQSQVEAAGNFERKHNMTLNIALGDMRDLQFPDESFSCVYTYNSSIHLSKRDTRKAVDEMLRVLKPDGVMYINFIWDLARSMYGEERAPGEFWMIVHDGDEVLHTLYSEEEADEIMKGQDILLKDKQQLAFKHEDEVLNDAIIHYYLKKTRE